ncbi:16S rRNA (guanine(966)-N(2))-methyltransferase RsmD [Microbacterium sp. SCN 69-37]|uniref:16S rRNA (guanine(966)-N(2))-methyltransferase RsmD n=1 Tax=Microbacterium sp. SCN 69-37 TaxID=1660115 RepID=UPI000A9922C1|nr:16S rRNA (guanine(966)-N(2))-methyltransferase RsmD [Microbacterium sp. SCN 69-37]
MTRIISGAAGSLTLGVPDAGTRPTSDRVRESLFGALDAADIVDGAAVLDLFAGSGALGLEAASRGAASVDLVEKAPRAAAVADRNARTVAKVLPGTPIRVHRSSVEAYLRAAARTFDLVFIDPPYDLADTELARVLEMLAPRLAPDALVVVERATRSGAPTLPDALQYERDKSYGDTTLWWVRPQS